MTHKVEPHRVSNSLINKLARIVRLNEREKAVLRTLCGKARQHRRGTVLITEGDKPDSIYLLLEGWAFGYKHLENGRRQILSYLLPGDLSDIRIFLCEEMDHSISLLSDALVVKISAAEMLDLVDSFPRIGRALMWATLVYEATLREWLFNVGRRQALQRVSHLFCELCVRLKVVDLVDSNERFALPLTQRDLADTSGITTAHANRCLQLLRRDGLIILGNGSLTILDFQRLSKIAGFNETYLRTGGPPT